MTIKEITKLFKDNGLDVDNYGLGSIHHEMQFQHNLFKRPIYIGLFFI